MKKIATDIKTVDWRKILEGLIGERWKIVSQYEGYDAGIDFDFIVLKKNGQKILFGWDNWSEGEIKCSAEIMEEISAKYGVAFQFGKPQNLTPFIIGFTRLQNLYTDLKKR